MVAQRLRVELKLIALNYRDEANEPRYPEPRLLSAVPELGTWRRVLLVDDVQFLTHRREMQAELVARGEAIAGTITAVRDEGTGKRSVPVWTVESEGELPLRLVVHVDEAPVVIERVDRIVASHIGRVGSTYVVNIKLINIRLADERYSSWKQFLDTAYWTVELRD